MKTLITTLILIALFTAGCKKGSSSKGSSATKTYLLSKVTYTAVVGGFTNAEEYTYDSQNRVTVFNEGNNVFKYAYDSNNNLTTVLTYNSAGSLTATDNYTYAGNVVTANTFYGDGSVNGSYTFTLNAQQEPTNLSIAFGNIQYQYDGNGNATSYSATGALTQSDSYTYDTKKNPLSMIGAKNLHLIYLAQGTPITTVNNVLVDEGYPRNYAYTYNSDGFPVSAVLSTNSGPGSNITYEYIIK
jgi:hypothetical protein